MNGALVLLMVLTGVSGQQPRDPVRSAAGGHATISGVIADADGRPLRRARVTLAGGGLEHPRTMITSDDGAFAFAGVRSGHYSLSASKDGHVSMNYGAGRPGRAGRPLIVGGQSTVRADLRLPRGAVITGVVLSAEGEPVPSATVMAMISAYDASHGGRRQSIVDNGRVVTDDRGVYRIFGLAEGSYYVAVVPRFAAVPGDLQVMTEGEVRAALAEVRDTRAAARPGIPVAAPTGVDPLERKTVGFTPVFYPGTALPERATAIDLRAGEVRHGIDLDLNLVPMSTIEGSVSLPPGMRAQVLIASAAAMPFGQMNRTSSTGQDGRFRFHSLAPGTYTISARAFPNGPNSGPMLGPSNLWGRTGVTVSGEDITGVTVALQPPVSVSGRLVFEGTGSRPGALPPMRIPLFALLAGSTEGLGLPPAVIQGASFSMTDIVPGTYRFPSPPRGVRSPIGAWWIKSAVIGGKEVLDAEVELLESRDDAVITLSDRASELSGTVRRGDGAAVDWGFVVVFSADPRFWFYQSRRIVGVRVTERGKYVVRNLPAGDYLIAFTEDLNNSEWFDPQALPQLARDAQRISLRENEVKGQDLSLPAASRR